MNMRPKFPKPRSSFWIAIDPETRDALGYHNEDEAFESWSEIGNEFDFYRIDPDGHHSFLNDDFEDRLVEEHREARSWARHCSSYARPS